MPRQRPPYLIRRTGRQGETLWYYWRRPGPQIRIRGDYGTREFWLAYEQAAISRGAVRSIQKPTKSLGWLLDRYRESKNWTSLAPSTRQLRERILYKMLKFHGDFPYEKIDRAMIVSTRDSMAAGSSNFIDAIRGLFVYAVEAGFIDTDPTQGVKNIKTAGEGFRTWTQDDIAAFRRKWPVGTRERLALELLLNTGLRRGDVARLGRQHIRDGRLRITTEKTGALINIPVSQALMDVIAASPVGDLALIAVQKTGNPMTKQSFGNWFKEAAEAAGVNGNCHGLRKAAATRLAEAGATVPELNAIFGWTGHAMAMLYIEKANREKLADNAASKLAGNAV